MPNQCPSRPSVNTSLIFKVVNAACQRCSLPEEAHGTPALRHGECCLCGASKVTCIGMEI